MTEEALARAIAVCGPGKPVNSIGATIHAFADTYGYGVVEAFVGHGVGREFHSVRSSPWVPLHGIHSMKTTP